MYLYTAFSPASGPTILATLSSIIRPRECSTPSSILDSKPSAHVAVNSGWIVHHAFCKEFPCLSAFFKRTFSADSGQVVRIASLRKDFLAAKTINNDHDKSKRLLYE